MDARELEVRCAHCNAGFAAGTRVCVHCNRRIGTGGATLLGADAGVEAEEPDADEVGAGGVLQRMGPGLVTLVLVALGIASRACSGQLGH